MLQFPDSMEELLENPSKYGVPTLDEFVRDKEKWMGRADDEITAIDRGDRVLGCKQRYYVEGYSVPSLEVAQRIASDMGFDLLHDFIIDPQLRPDPTERRGFYNEVTFRSKAAIARRAGW